ncbi:TPA: hypothetical protein TXL57_001650 [Streptococcus suis]|nr:hypothetical protein [Streptococcus suis]
MIIVLTTTWIGIWFSRNNPTLLFQSETLSINGTRKTIRGKEILGRLEEVEQLIAYDISKRYLDVASIQFVKVGRNKEHGTSSMFDDEKFYASILVNDSTTLIYKFNLSDDEETTVYSAPTDDDEITLIEDSNFEEFHQQPTSSDIVKQLASIDITYYLKEDIYRYYDPYDR